MILAMILAAAQPQVLAVLELRDKAPASECVDATSLSDQVRSAVRDLLPQVKVITRENMLTLLRAGAQDLAGCERGCEVETARRLGADLVVSGELLRSGTPCELDMKLHDARSGELLSNAVAVGASADELEKSLRPAVEKLLTPLRPEAFQDQLSDRRQAARAALREPQRSLFAFSGHVAAGYGRASGDGTVVSLQPGAISDAASSVALAIGADAGVRLGSVFSLGVFGESDPVFTDKTVHLRVAGALTRLHATDALSLALGVGVGWLGTSTSGAALLGAADYLVHGPFAVHAQVVWANEASGGSLFPGGDEVVTVAGGVAVLF